MTTEADTARSAASYAAEAIRTINLATLHRDDFAVGDVYAIAADCAAAQHRLRQATEQLAVVLGSRLEHGVLRHDTDGDTDAAILDAQVSLGRAGDLAAQCAQLFDQAQNTLGPIADRGDRTKLQLVEPISEQ